MKIDSLNAIKIERTRLKMQIEDAEEKLKEDFNWMLDELRPLNAISKGVGSIFNTRNNGLVGDTIGAGIGLLVNKIFLKNSSWIMRILVPQILKNISSNMLADRQVNILSVAKDLIHKFRTARHSGNGLYDRSTAQSNY